VLSRLIQEPSDAHPQVKKRLLAYRALLPAVESEFKGCLIRINAEDPPQTIMRSFCEAIEYSV